MLLSSIIHRTDQEKQQRKPTCEMSFLKNLFLIQRQGDSKVRPALQRCYDESEDLQAWLGIKSGELWLAVQWFCSAATGAWQKCKALFHIAPWLP